LQDLQSTPASQGPPRVRLGNPGGSEKFLTNSLGCLLTSYKIPRAAELGMLVPSRPPWVLCLLVQAAPMSDMLSWHSCLIPHKVSSPDRSSDHDPTWLPSPGHWNNPTNSTVQGRGSYDPGQVPTHHTLCPPPGHMASRKPSPCPIYGYPDS
jgi:hypothetical protein